MDRLIEQVKAERHPTPAAARAIGKGAGVSAADLAAGIGVAERTILFWERGQARPRRRNRRESAEALELLKREART